MEYKHKVSVLSDVIDKYEQ